MTRALALLPLLGTLALGCGGSSTSHCSTGMSVACSCATGATGAQVCLTDGTFGACSCSVSMDLGSGDAAMTQGADLSEATDLAVAPANKRVFITATSYGPNFAATAGTSDGLAGADGICAIAASAASLGGKWKAWLSNSVTSAIDRINEVGPWYRLDGQEAFTGKANLASVPLVTLSITEQGTASTAAAVWTGTQNGGTASTSCEWGNDPNHLNVLLTSGIGSGTSTSDWTAAGTRKCDGSVTLPLYCFEQ